MSIPKSMLLITSAWNGQHSFKLIPISKECAFSEGIFDPEYKTLAMLSWDSKETLRIIPARDENGDVAKTKAPRENGKRFKEKQVTLNLPSEFHMTEKEEIIKLIDMIAINAADYDYKKFLTATTIIVPETPKIEIIQP